MNVTQQLSNLSVYWNHLEGGGGEGWGGLQNYCRLSHTPGDSGFIGLGYVLGFGGCQRSPGGPNVKLLGTDCHSTSSMSPRLSLLVCSMGVLSVCYTGSALAFVFLKIQASTFNEWFNILSLKGVAGQDESSGF